MNYFEIFNLPQTYDIDQELLRKSYFTTLARYHPDNSANDANRLQNLQYSMLINEAFKTLKDNFERAVYIIKLSGLEFNDESSKNIIPTHELADILEQYELLENTENLQLLLDIEKEKILEQKLLIARITSAFAENNIKQALDLTLKLKYLNKLLENLRLKIKNADS